MSVFDKRVAFKPFEYDVLKYGEAIQESYWTVKEFGNFTSDVQDFKTKLSVKEQNIVKNALLAVSQIEVAVKRFWTKLGERFPKSEFELVGVIFGESEARHALAYSKLLEVLGFNDEFELLVDNPVIKGRVDYLTKYLKNANDNDNEKYSLTLALFSLFIENVSLFSQFLILKSFYKYKNALKDIDNVIQATAKEEIVHSLFGSYLVNLIKKEKPQWFGEDYIKQIIKACKKSYDAEEKIIDWIFENGELSFLKKETVKEFTKDRFNQSLNLIEIKPIFEINKEELSKVFWMEEEILAHSNTDFWHQKSPNYSKKTKPIKSDNLF